MSLHEIFFKFSSLIAWCNYSYTYIFVRQAAFMDFKLSNKLLEKKKKNRKEFCLMEIIIMVFSRVFYSQVQKKKKN